MGEQTGPRQAGAKETGAAQAGPWDVAIIGAGATGQAITAACLAAGRSVLLCEREPAEAAAPDPLAGFAARGATVVRASAHFIAPDRLEAAGRSHGFRHAVIAGGSTPLVPDLPGLGSLAWLTPRDLPGLDESLEHLLILGGGATAVRLAQQQARLGRQVSLVLATPNILPGEDLELVEPLRAVLRRDGIALHENTPVLDASHAGAGVALLLAGGARLQGSHLLLALGEAPRLSPLDLATAGIEATPRGIAVGGDLRASGHRNIWAAGSIADTGQAAVAPGQHAAVVAAGLLHGRRAVLGGTAPPRLSGTHPCLAQVGMTEAEARAQPGGGTTQVIRLPLPHELWGEGMAKLVADARGRLLGASLLAGNAGEAAALLAVAIGQGMTGPQFAGLPLPRGTLAAALAQAAAHLPGGQFPSTPKQRILGALDRWL